MRSRGFSRRSARETSARRSARSLGIGVSMAGGVCLRSVRQRRFLDAPPAMPVAHEVGGDEEEGVAAMDVAVERGAGFQKPVIRFLQQIVGELPVAA